MKRNSTILGFHCLSRMDYFPELEESTHRDGKTDNIMFGKYAPHGGCDGEMGMTWYSLNNEEVPRLEVFSADFSMLNEDVFQRLIANLKEDMTPDMFSKMLIEHGFKDLSDYPLKK